MLSDVAAIRTLNRTPYHVPVVGLVAAAGGRLLLVEAPYQYTALKEYLAAHPHTDRQAMVRQNELTFLTVGTLLAIFVACKDLGDSR